MNNLEREIADHIERRTEELVGEGIEAVEARRRARAEFGSPEAVAEEMRDARQLRWLRDAAQDVRFALRAWRRTPGFAITALAILALGIGVNAVMFGVLHATLLRPLPYASPNRLIYISEYDNHGNEQSFSIPDLRDFMAQNHSFTSMGGYRDLQYTLLEPGRDPEAVNARLVFAGTFHTLGVNPVLGRGFSAHDHQPNGPAEIILSYDYWQEHFGGSAGAVGRSLTLAAAVGSKTWTVVGVMPRGFAYGRQIALYIPYEQVVQGLMFTARQYSWWLYGVARLKPGVTLAQAKTDVAGISSRLARQYPDSNATVRAEMEPLADNLTSGVRASLWTVFAAVTALLLLVAVNLASVLLVRAAGRGEEMAVRAALGAGRGRLARQLLAEGLLLAVVGGGAGLALAAWGLRAVAAALPSAFPLYGGLGLDGNVAAYGFGLAMLTGLLFSLAPILLAARVSLRSRSAPGRQRLHSILIVAEVGLAMALLASSGLMLRSLASLNRVDLGFQPDHLLTVSVGPHGLTNRAQMAAYYRSLRDRAAALPGVESAAVGGPVPFTPQILQLQLAIEGRAADPSNPLSVWGVACGPKYFRTIGMPLLLGRTFTAADLAPGAPSVVIVDRTLADQYWGSPAKALGSHVQVAVASFGSKGHPISTVVGVVGPLKAEGADIAPHREMYSPSYTWGTLVLRTAGDPTALVPALRAMVHRYDATLAPPKFTSLDQLIAAAEGTRLVSTRLLTVFALAALLLAGLGLYGVLAFLVQQRRRELGIRLALGASRRALQRDVLAHGLRLALAGLLLGGASAAVGSRLLAGLLFGVGPDDATTYAAVAGVLLLAAAAAAYVPARRAARVDPMLALRAE